jgi:hypothetical protein
MNVRFDYLYRDGGNYKSWGAVVFSNPDLLPLQVIDSYLRLGFDQDGLFIADQIQIPEVFLFLTGNFTSDDHCFHEYDHVELTEDAPDDSQGRTIAQFLEQVELESHRGWRAFDPCDRIVKRTTVGQKTFSQAQTY